VNPCCYYPCQNKGVCMRVGWEDYECDCTRTGYFGINCTLPEFWTRLRVLLKPSPAVYHFILTHCKWLWDIINTTFVRDTLMKLVLTVRANLIPSPPTYNSAYGYISWESYANVSYFTRVLPPVPEDCPTPMGTSGKKQPPNPQLLAEKFLLRRQFQRDPRGTNLMFAFFAQHFTHQFFKTSGKMGPGFTKALGHGVGREVGRPPRLAPWGTGTDLARLPPLLPAAHRLWSLQLRDGEMYPPTVLEAEVHMIYPPGTPKATPTQPFPPQPGLCSLHHECQGLTHRLVHKLLLMPVTTGSAPLSLSLPPPLGETIKIVVEEYVQHLSGYFLRLKFDPELLFDVQFQYRNRIAVEFNQLYHWHGLMPDSFVIQGKEYSYQQFIYNTSMLMDYGVEALVESFSKQIAGKVGGGQSINTHLLKVAVGVIEESRLLRLQPFNEYRKRFSMKPYKSFQELTGEEEKAAALEELYGDINALEFYPGLLLEKPQPNSMFGESMVETGAPFSLKGLFGNPICSPEYWKPSTFGGAAGFEIVKTASLQKLVCRNVRRCPFVSFHVPEPSTETGTTGDHQAKNPSTEL
uniref:Prostaglandin G/H synthase 1 n=1 Tax=Pelodiscus sinensis TaxID=13735 RepID=K7FAZ3_PELSI